MVHLVLIPMWYDGKINLARKCGHKLSIASCQAGRFLYHLSQECLICFNSCFFHMEIKKNILFFFNYLTPDFFQRKISFHPFVKSFMDLKVIPILCLSTSNASAILQKNASHGIVCYDPITWGNTIQITCRYFFLIASKKIDTG